MSKVRRKITKYEIILCVLVLAVIVAGLLLPKTGELVLLDEFCNISVIWIVCIYVVVRVIHMYPTANTHGPGICVDLSVSSRSFCTPSNLRLFHSTGKPQVIIPIISCDSSIT